MTYLADRDLELDTAKKASPPISKPAGKRFLVLDSWRGICAICVALYHLPLLSNIYVVPFVRSSYLFVDFFFVLSGFVIEHAYGSRLWDGEGAKTFLIRRFARVWPLHAAMLLFLIVTEIGKAISLSAYHGPLIAMPFTGATSFPAIVYNLLLVNSLGIYHHGTWNTPGWSISVEFYTYVVFAITYLAAPRRHFYTAAVLSVAGAVLLSLTSHNHIGVTSDYGFFRCLYGFFLGNLVYAVYRQQPRFLERAKSKVTLTILELVAIATIVIFVSAAGEGPATMAAPLVFAVGVYIFAQEGGVISKFMSRDLFRLVGALSYSIYMVHWVYFNTLSRFAKIFMTQLGIHYDQRLVGGEETWIWSMDHYSTVTVDLVIFLLLASSIGLAYFTYTYIEKPGRRLLEKGLLGR